MSSTDKDKNSVPRHLAPGRTGRHSPKPDAAPETTPEPAQEAEIPAAPVRHRAEDPGEHDGRGRHPRPEGEETPRRRPSPQGEERREPKPGVGKKRKKKRRKKKAKKTVWIVLGILAAVILGILLFYFLWVSEPETSDVGLKQQATATPDLTAEKPVQKGEKAPDPAAQIATSQTPEPSGTSVPVKRKEDTYTLLVVGRDRVGSNTDTMMLARMDCKAGTVDVVSLPRDTLVDVPWGVKKLNSVYGALGTEGLLDYVENLVGFGIDSYVIINTFVFQELIDCIGGVYFDVPMNMDYDDASQGLSIHLSPGYQLLNGAQAEGVVRFRKNNDGSGYARGDIARIETQQAFLKAAAKQVLDLGNIANLPEMVNIVLNNTDTNLTSGNIAFYAQEFLKMDSDSINFYTMPYDGVGILGGSYVSIRLDEWLEMINDHLNPFTENVTAENLNVLTYDEKGFHSTVGNRVNENSFYDYTGGTTGKDG